MPYTHIHRTIHSPFYLLISMNCHYASASNSSLVFWLKKRSNALIKKTLMLPAALECVLTRRSEWRWVPPDIWKWKKTKSRNSVRERRIEQRRVLSIRKRGCAPPWQMGRFVQTECRPVLMIAWHLINVGPENARHSESANNTSGTRFRITCRWFRIAA